MWIPVQYGELLQWKWSGSVKNEQKVDLLQVRYFNRFLEDGKQMTQAEDKGCREIWDSEIVQKAWS